MKVQCWKILDEGGLEAVDAATAIDAWKRKQGSFWADIDYQRPDELDRWLRQIDLSDSVRECCLATGVTARLVPFEEGVFFEFPVFQGGPESRLTELGFFCRDRLIITMHKESVTSLEQVALKLTSDGGARPLTTSGLLAAISLVLIGHSIRTAASLKNAVYALDERMDRQPDVVDADELRRRKRTLRDLDTVVGEQSATFRLLSVIDPPSLDLKGLGELFGAVSRNSSSADRAVDRVEKLLADLQQRYDANRQERTNQRLALLTVISAIFLPLSLLTGIYGMNFDVMPELHFPYAYPVALCLMGAIAVGLYRYFRSRGWLD